MPWLLNGLGKRVHLGAMSFPLLGHLSHGRARRKLVRQTRNEGMFVEVTCRVERRDMMRTRRIGSLMAVAVLLAGVGMVSAGVIRQDIEFDGRPVVLILPENFDKGNDLYTVGPPPPRSASLPECSRSGIGCQWVS